MRAGSPSMGTFVSFLKRYSFFVFFGLIRWLVHGLLKSNNTRNISNIYNFISLKYSSMTTKRNKLFR